MKNHPGYVYFAQAADGLVKIGWTRDVQNRVYFLSGYGHGRVTLLGVAEGSRQLERHFHRRYHRARVTGEWFRPTRALVRYAKSRHQDIASIPVYSRFGSPCERVALKLDIHVVDALRSIAAEDGRSIDGQANYMIKKCLLSGDHLDRQRMVAADLYGRPEAGERTLEKGLAA